MNDKLIKETAKRAAVWWAGKIIISDPGEFMGDLERRIELALKTEGRVRIENDYDPQGILLDAVRATVDPECRGAFFSGDGLFPRKHSTTVTPGLIEPKEGYGNWTEAIKVYI